MTECKECKRLRKQIIGLEAKLHMAEGTIAVLNQGLQSIKEQVGLTNQILKSK